SGDTVRMQKMDTAFADKAMLRSFDTSKVFKNEEGSFILAGNQVQKYRLQTADGVIETCKTAVNLCIGLIGIMALFMGFMCIAERAGGIRFLSRIIGPFFSRIF